MWIVREECAGDAQTLDTLNKYNVHTYNCSHKATEKKIDSLIL